jgi:hypothetical protein
MKFKTIASVGLEYINQDDHDRILGIYVCASIHELQNYLNNVGIKLTNQQIYIHSKKAINPILGFIVKNKNNVIIDFKNQERAKKAYEIGIQIMRADTND